MADINDRLDYVELSSKTLTATQPISPNPPRILTGLSPTEIAPESSAQPAPRDEGHRHQPVSIGEFTIVRQVGKGGMGIVYEATQESLKRTVALKVLPLIGRFDQRQIQRFQNEAHAAAQLDHPNIVPIYSLGMDAGYHFYAMKLIQGRDLAGFIRDAKIQLDSKTSARRVAETPRITGDQTAGAKPNPLKDTKEQPLVRDHDFSVGTLKLGTLVDQLADRTSSPTAHSLTASVVQIGIQAAEALQHAHSYGVVHRDIKPSNLMLDDDGKVWVTDFGLAQVQGVDALTMTGEFVGTLRYMSPEQPLGQRVLVDQRTDIYSLGVTLYELLTLQKAIGGSGAKEIIKHVCFDDPPPIRMLHPRIPEDLETIVMKAIAKNPADRYQTAQELADDLRLFSRDQPIRARRPTLLQRARRWARKHQLLATSAAVAMVVLTLTSLAASGMILNALTAETQQRKRAESLLAKSEGLRLTATSSLETPRDPGLALLLAVEGANLNPGVDANSALLNAMAANHELRTLTPRRDDVSPGICISPDSQRVVTTADRYRYGKGSLPAIESDLRTGELRRTFDDGTTIISAGYSPNGKFLLTTSGEAPDNNGKTPSFSLVAGPEATPKLWNTQSGEHTFTFIDAVLADVHGSEFSPNSDLVALPGKEHNVHIYSTADGRLEGSLPGHSDRVIAVAFSPDGNRLVSMSLDRTVRVWDVANANELRKFSVDVVERTLNAHFTADSNSLVISSDSGTQFYSVATGEKLNPQHWTERSVALSRDGRYAAAQLGRSVKIRDLTSFHTMQQIELQGTFVSQEFTPDGEHLLVTTETEASIYRTETGAKVARLEGHTEMLLAGRLTPDGTHVVTSAMDMTVRYWSVRSGKQRATLSEEMDWTAPSPLSFSEDSALATISMLPTFQVGLRDLMGKPVSARFSGRVRERLAKSSRLVTHDDHSVEVWNTNTSRRLARCRLESEHVFGAIGVPNTDVIAITCTQGPLLLWNPETDQTMRCGPEDQQVAEIDVHPASGQIAVARLGSACGLLDAVTGNLVKPLPHDKDVVDVAFSRTGSRLLTIDADYVVRIWTLEGDEPPVVLQVPDHSLDWAEFSSDESVVLTWSRREQDLVRCWRTDTGEPVSEYGPVTKPWIDLCADQPIAAVASSKEGLVVWNWNTGEQSRLSESPTMSPLFLADRLMSIEAVSGFQTISSRIPSFSADPAFVRSVIAVRDLATLKVIATEPLDVEPWHLSLDSDTGNAVLSSRVHAVALTRLADQHPVTPLGTHAGPVTFQTITHGSQRIICASMDGKISVSDATGRRLHLLEKHQHPVISAAASPDGLRLASFDSTGSGILWNIENGRSIIDLPGHDRIVPIVRFSASGKQLLTSGTDATIHIRDLISQTEKVLTFEPGVVSADWTPDESRIVVVTGDIRPLFEPTGPWKDLVPPPAAFLVDPGSGKKLDFQVDGIPRMALCRPGGKQVIVLTREGRATLFDASTGQAVKGFDPNRWPIHRMSFSPDGMDLLVLHDNEMSLWDLDAGDEVVRIPLPGDNHIGRVERLFTTDWMPFSPNGRWIYSSDGQLLQWPRDPLQEALLQTPRQLTDAEKRRFSVGLATVKVP